MTDNVTLAGKIVEKKLLIQQQLKNTIAAYNETVNKKEELFNQIKQLQGALQILAELDHVSDTSSDTEPT
tara:strand:+ start:406 stop:615 length:210 start_codon:yes stop_codon:yes gene_type:complete